MSKTRQTPTFSRYEILDELGSGGMGVVYLARHRRLKRQVAFKLLPPALRTDGDALARFEREAQALAQLRHRHIAQIYDAEVENGFPYLAIEYIEGHDLETLLRRDGPLTPEQVVKLGQQMASALAHVHAQGLIHRDVKASNIMIRPNGNAVLTDFGIVFAAERSRISRGVVGTLAYMSPEQLEGNALDERSDLYSLGVVLYEALLGQVPFPERGTSLQDDLRLQMDILQTAPPPLTAVPPRLNTLILQCLAKDRDDRFATAPDLAAALTEALAPPAPSPPKPTAPKKFTKKHLFEVTPKKFTKKRLFKVAREMNVSIDTLIQHLEERGYAHALTGKGVNAALTDEDAYLDLQETYAANSAVASRIRALREVRRAALAATEHAEEEAVQGEASQATLGSPLPSPTRSSAHVRTEPIPVDKPRPTPVQPSQTPTPDYRWLLVLAVLLMGAVTLGVWSLAQTNPSPEATTAGTPAQADSSPIPTRQPGSIATNNLGMTFAYIPPGSFQRGSEDGTDSEKPVREITISEGFELQTTEVTQAQWQVVMGTTLREQRDMANPEWSLYGEGASYPMYYVSWEEAQTFIRRLNGRNDGYTYRLPTEAEWEYAARAGTTTRYHFGENQEQLGAYAWYGQNSGRQTHPVGEKRPNAWGLYDMHGNVWEWVQDWYDSNYYSHSPNIDPRGPDSGTFRVLRGGSWNDNPGGLRAAYRYNFTPSFRSSNVGFRVARTR